MKNLEIVARTQKEAVARAAERLGVPAEELDVIEEYEPDELDLKALEEIEKGTPTSAEPPTLYIVRQGSGPMMKKAREWVAGLMDRFNPGIGVDASMQGDQILIRLDAPDASIIIGKQGQTLEALQHIVSRAFVVQGGETFPEVVLDIGGYREKRMRRIEHEARRAAERATRSRRPVALPPMSASERKFVHNLLVHYGGVTTSSTGHDSERHIVVHPAGQAPQKISGNVAPPQGNRSGNRQGGGEGGQRRGGGGGNRQGGDKRRGGGNPQQRPGLQGDQPHEFKDTPLEGAASATRMPEYREDAVDQESLNPNRKLVDEIE